MSQHNLYKVEGYNDLIKDKSSGAVLLSDKSVADEYRAKKAMLQKTREMGSELSEVKAEVKELKSDMREIKEMLQRIVSK